VSFARRRGGALRVQLANGSLEQPALAERAIVGAKGCYRQLSRNDLKLFDFPHLRQLSKWRKQPRPVRSECTGVVLAVEM
jgi:hypothetical protein